MLHIGANYRCRAFWTQRDVTASAVGELVHLLCDHVGRVSRAAAEHVRVFEARADDKAETEPLCQSGEAPHELRPTRALRSENVLSSLGGLEAGHPPAGARAPLLPGTSR